jgi:hypothetical protein
VHQHITQAAAGAVILTAQTMAHPAGLAVAAQAQIITTMVQDN